VVKTNHTQANPPLSYATTSSSTGAPAPDRIRGYVDMHTHPMSYLGFGGKALHGAPGYGVLLPAAMADCDSPEMRTESIAQALGHCNGTHGGWGLDNTCGDYLRAAILNKGLDDKFTFYPQISSVHGDHPHAGYPDFPAWPNQTSMAHQQMWWEWIKRAYDGGLRVMVALAVNNELLAEILNGIPPYDDQTAADRQIDEMIRFVDDSRNGGFMKIVRSSSELRDAVKQNKLAVVLGVEVDHLGNLGKYGVLTNENTVRAEIARLYGKGVRYAFPVHVVDNVFGGAAVYELLFNFANRRANGEYFAVRPSFDPNVTYREGLSYLPVADLAVLTLHGALQALGELPAPCFSFPDPFPHLKYCGSYQSIVNALSPSPELEFYNFLPGGHQNARGLTPLGEVAINEMMRLGMLIDIDHMSELSANRTIEIAQPNYPLLMGHNGIRGAAPNANSERSVSAQMASRVAQLGGLLGLGTSDATPEDFISQYHAAQAAMGPEAGIGIGTDVDGFARLPKKSEHTNNSDTFYYQFTSDVGEFALKAKQMTGNHTWDYVQEGGVSHYGLLPEFLFDVKSRSNDGPGVLESLMQSAEKFTQMWAKVETAAQGRN